jgi:hypothetical protein
MGASQTVLPFKLAAARRTSGKRQSSPRGRVVLAFPGMLHRAVRRPI